MIDEYGIVTKERDGKLGVQVMTPGACESCLIHDNCYSSGNLVWIPKQEGIHLHDHIRFSIANTSVLGVSALVYGIPLIAVLGGVLLGYLLLFRTLTDDAKVLTSVLLGVILFLLSGFGISRLDRRIRSRLSYTVVRVDPAAGDEKTAPPKSDSMS